jgi:undecaprenyl phosphate-alpha-L-ara4N flippase subunit ArnE
VGETKSWAILVVVACTFFTSFGSLFIKKGVDKFSFSIAGLLDSYMVFVGLFFYFIGFILLTVAFKHGELSVLFPFVSLSFVWVAVLSSTLLGEQVTMTGILGVCSIVLGVVLIGVSSRQDKRKLGIRG